MRPRASTITLGILLIAPQGPPKFWVFSYRAPHELHRDCILMAMMTHGRLRAAQRFFRTFLEGREDREVRVSDWRRHPAVGRLREVSFVSAVKRTMGISPPFAHCHQTQRYR